MRFLKDVLRGDKILIKAGDIHHFNIPRFDELAVNKLFDQIKNNSHIIAHLNYYYSDSKEELEHKFFFGVLSTLATNYLSKNYKRG